MAATVPDKKTARRVRSDGPEQELLHEGYDMSTYRIYFTTGASASVEVEADDLEAAIELAYDEVPSGVCAQCSGWGRDYDFDLGGDWDVDENGHEVDGEYVDTSKPVSA